VDFISGISSQEASKSSYPEHPEHLPGMPDDITFEATPEILHLPEVTDDLLKEPQLTTHLLSPETYVQPAPPAPDQGKFFQRQDFPLYCQLQQKYLPSAKSVIPMVEVSDCDVHKRITSLDGGSDLHSLQNSLCRSIDSLATQSNLSTDPQTKEHAVENHPVQSPIMPKMIGVPEPPKKFVRVSKRTPEEIQEQQRSRLGMDKSLAGESRPNDWMKMALDGCETAPKLPYRCQWTAKRQPLKGMYGRRQTLKTPDEMERGQTPDLMAPVFREDEDDPLRCGHCSNQFGEEPLSMLVDFKRRIRTCSHFLHQKCCEELCSLKKTNPEIPPACPLCDAVIVDSRMLPNPFKDPDGWFDALDVHKCGRVPRPQIAEALVVATKLDVKDVDAILDSTMGGNRFDRYECLDCRYILAKVEKQTVRDAMDSMRAFSRLGHQMEQDLDTDIDSDDDVDAWILSITERRCAKLPKPSAKSSLKRCKDINHSQWMNNDSSPMDGMTALAELSLRRRELAFCPDTLLRLG